MVMAARLPEQSDSEKEPVRSNARPAINRLVSPICNVSESGMADNAAGMAPVHSTAPYSDANSR